MKDIKISYAITVAYEMDYFKDLFEFILKHKDTDDEIVILHDFDASIQERKEVAQYILSKETRRDIKYIQDSFKGDFATWKNLITSHCSGDWVFQIDADEMPNEFLINNLKEVLRLNPQFELFLVPRINTVEGLTMEHIKKWRWKVENMNGHEAVNFPDYQTRIYQKNPRIKWFGNVHEVITGHTLYSLLPAEEEWCLYHHKTIDRQEKQNAYYDTIQ